MGKNVQGSGKICQDCGGMLYWVFDSEYVDGVEYLHKYLYCRDCGNEEEYRPKKRRTIGQEGGE